MNKVANTFEERMEELKAFKTMQLVTSGSGYSGGLMKASIIFATLLDAHIDIRGKLGR